MRLLVKIGYIALVGFVAFWMVYGLYEPFRTGVNNWVLNSLGPGAAATWTNVSTQVTTNPSYITYHGVLWLAGGVVLAYSVHQLHAGNKIPGFHTSDKGQTKTVTMQREPVEQEPQQQPANEEPAVQEQTA